MTRDPIAAALHRHQLIARHMPAALEEARARCPNAPAHLQVAVAHDLAELWASRDIAREERRVAFTVIVDGCVVDADEADDLRRAA